MLDVAIIGCGVVGAAAAYELSHYPLHVAVLEAENDVADGTTKANSAILHAGYDPEPGTQMARLNVQGVALAKEICAKLDVSYKQCGSLVLALDEKELPHLQHLFENGTANGVPDMKILSREETLAMEPNLSEKVCGALWAPSAAIVNPWEYALAMTEVAVRNGVELRRSCRQLTRIPAEEYMAYSELTNRASDVWHKAKEENDFASFCPILQELVEYNRKFAGYYDAEKAPYDALLNWCRQQAAYFAPFICDVGAFLQQAHDSGKRIVLEAQLGAMRDIDYGIFPFTSSSNTLAAYAPLGAGIPNCKLDHVVGVLKAYSTCVGAGPFAAENAMGEAWNEKLRKAGGEYGAATGRPRRVGPFDCVASRYGLQCQGADKIALTKLDVLSSMKQIPVITGYKLDGVEVPRFDTLSDLDRVQPVVTLLPGWNKDISGCRSWTELPKEAKAYVEFLEKQLGHEIQFVSTGAEREKFVLKGEWL